MIDGDSVNAPTQRFSREYGSPAPLDVASAADSGSADAIHPAGFSLKAFLHTFQGFFSNALKYLTV